VRPRSVAPGTEGVDQKADARQDHDGGDGELQRNEERRCLECEDHSQHAENGAGISGHFMVPA
jgi:hypothetical protein